MKKKRSAKSTRKATGVRPVRVRSTTAKRVTGGREPTKHPAKVTIPDIKL